jgi:hypothetical protein
MRFFNQIINMTFEAGQQQQGVIMTFIHFGFKLFSNPQTFKKNFMRPECCNKYLIGNGIESYNKFLNAIYKFAGKFVYSKNIPPT